MVEMNSITRVISWLPTVFKDVNLGHNRLYGFSLPYGLALGSEDVRGLLHSGAQVRYEYRVLGQGKNFLSAGTLESAQNPNSFLSMIHRGVCCIID